MATRVTIRMVPGFENILQSEPGVKAIVSLVAKRAEQIAVFLAPVEEGEYRDGIKAEGTNLNATWWTSHWIEWGSEHNRAFGTLRQAAAEVARVVEAPK